MNYKQVNFKRFYHHSHKGFYVFTGFVYLQPFFSFMFAQKGDRISSILIFGHGMIYFNPHINLDFHNFESNIFSTMHRIYGERVDYKTICQLLLPISDTFGDYKFSIITAIDHTGYRYEHKESETKFKNHDWSNIAPYWWTKEKERQP